MQRILLVTLAVACTAALAACGQEEPPLSDAPGETPIPVEPGNGIGDGAPPPEAGAQQITGTLGGDAELEGGCAWIDGQEGTRYEVYYPEGYEVRFAPLELVGPDDETVATEGDTVTVTGQVAEDMMSFCQVGTIFSATEVEA